MPSNDGNLSVTGDDKEMKEGRITAVDAVAIAAMILNGSK